MSELDDAIARLERAVARLDKATDADNRAAEDDRAAALTAAVIERIDAALAKLGRLLEQEE